MDESNSDTFWGRQKCNGKSKDSKNLIWIDSKTHQTTKHRLIYLYINIYLSGKEETGVYKNL